MSDDSSAREISETMVVNVPVSMAYNSWMQFTACRGCISGVDSVLPSDHCAHTKGVAIRLLREPKSLLGMIRVTHDVDATHVGGDLAGFTESGEERRKRKRSCQSIDLAGPVYPVVGSASDPMNPMRKARWRGGEGEDIP